MEELAGGGPQPPRPGIEVRQGGARQRLQRTRGATGAVAQRMLLGGWGGWWGRAEVAAVFGEGFTFMSDQEVKL